MTANVAPMADTRAIAWSGLVERFRAEGATRWLEAGGISMRPLVPPGSRLLIEFGRTDARVGDVVLFERRGGLVAHRVVAYRGRGAGLAVVPKGDGEALADGAILPTDILGIVRAFRTPDGRVVRTALGGRSGAIVARVSWWSARAGRLGRRAARRAPAPVRPWALAGADSLSRVPTRVITATMPRPDRGRSAERR